MLLPSSCDVIATAPDTSACSQSIDMHRLGRAGTGAGHPEVQGSQLLTSSSTALIRPWPHCQHLRPLSKMEPKECPPQCVPRALAQLGHYFQNARALSITCHSIPLFVDDLSSHLALELLFRITRRLLLLYLLQT